MKSKNLLWNHLLHIIKYLFSIKSCVSPVRFFIFNIDQAQIYRARASVQKYNRKLSSLCLSAYVHHSPILSSHRPPPLIIKSTKMTFLILLVDILW